MCQIAMYRAAFCGERRCECVMIVPLRRTGPENARSIYWRIAHGLLHCLTGLAARLLSIQCRKYHFVTLVIGSNASKSDTSLFFFEEKHKRRYFWATFSTLSRIHLNDMPPARANFRVEVLTLGMCECVCMCVRVCELVPTPVSRCVNDIEKDCVLLTRLESAWLGLAASKIHRDRH